MTTYKYAYQQPTEKVAKAVGKDLPISTRAAIEICKHIRYKPLEQAKRILAEAIELKRPVPFRRFTDGAGHKAGMGGGKYPIKACTHILTILESAEANAHNKGLGKDLKIIHVLSQRGPKVYHYGRQIRRKMKRTHVEVVLAQYQKKEKKKHEMKK